MECVRITVAAIRFVAVVTFPALLWCGSLSVVPDAAWGFGIVSAILIE